MEVFMSKYMFLIVVLSSYMVMLQASYDEAADQKVIYHALIQKFQEITSSSDADYVKQNKINSLRHLYINYIDPDNSLNKRMKEKETLCNVLGLKGAYVELNQDVNTLSKEQVPSSEDDTISDTESSHNSDIQDYNKAQSAEQAGQRPLDLKSEAVIAALAATQSGVGRFGFNDDSSDNSHSASKNSSIMTTKQYKQQQDFSFEEESLQRLQDYKRLTGEQELIFDRFGEPTIVDRQKTNLDQLRDVASNIGEKISIFFKGEV